jgi:ribosomal protein S18 acetylase RimI-like enzyme
MHVEPATLDDLNAIVGEQPAFWGERDLRHLHHPLLIHEFGETALVIRSEQGEVLAYLFALLTPRQIGYAHVVAVREGHRRRGLGQLLYEELAQIAGRRGATTLKAFTRPENTPSIAFHTALGFSAEEVPRYAWGEPRVVFRRTLG